MLQEGEDAELGKKEVKEPGKLEREAENKTMEEGIKTETCSEVAELAETERGSKETGKTKTETFSEVTKPVEPETDSKVVEKVGKAETCSGVTKPVETEMVPKEEDGTKTEVCIKAEMEESDTTCKEKIKDETDIKILKQSDEQETEPEKEMVTKEDKQDTDKSTKDAHQTEITVENEKVSENQTRSLAKGAKSLADQKEGEEKSAAATKAGGEKSRECKIGSKCSDVSKSNKVGEGRKKGKEKEDKSCIEGFDGPKRSDANSTVSKSSEVVGEGRKKAKEKYGKGGQVESAKHVSIRFDLTTVM